jgi:hypothetical protein
LEEVSVLGGAHWWQKRMMMKKKRKVRRTGIKKGFRENCRKLTLLRKLGRGASIFFYL